jgi:hypothetical protein
MITSIQIWVRWRPENIRNELQRQTFNLNSSNQGTFVPCHCSRWPYWHMQPASPPSPTQSLSVITLTSDHGCNSLKLSFRWESLVSVPGLVLCMYMFCVQYNFTHDISQVFWLAVVHRKCTKNITITSNIVGLPCPLIGSQDSSVSIATR